MYSNSRNDVPRVAQRYRTIAAHTRHCASIIVVFVVFCVHRYSLASLIRRTPPLRFSDTAITNHHSDTTIFQLRAHWVWISWSIGSENRSNMCPRWESNSRLPVCKASTLSTRPGSPLKNDIIVVNPPFIVPSLSFMSFRVTNSVSCKYKVYGYTIRGSKSATSFLPPFLLKSTAKGKNLLL